MLKISLIVVLLVSALIATGRAEDAYPTQPIHFIVPFAPGGGTDGQSRVLAAAVGKRLGQSVVVENVTGAGGTIGFNKVARADPDGYTILSTTPGFVINPFIQKNIAYDPARDFAPVILATTSPVILVVAADSPIHTVQDIIDMARAHPGSVSYGSAGIGSIAHLSGALFGALAGIKLVHVPYRGSEPATLDLLAGRITMQVENATSVLPQVRSGQLRAIAVGGTKPSALLPGIPTIAATVPGYESGGWYGILVPAKTPRPIIDRLNAAFNDSLADQSVKTAMAAFGVELVGGSPVVFADYLKSVSAESAAAAKAANLVPQ
jgi:tripartite-type tricarboxylate transporter receptor subunit TctC